MITQGTWGSAAGPISNVDFGLTELVNKLLNGKLNRFGSLLVNPNQAPAIGPESTDPSLQGLSVDEANKVLGAQETNPTGDISGGANTIDRGGILDTGKEIAGLTFQNVLDQANRQRGNARSVLQTILDSVGKYRDTAKQFYNNAGQSIINNAGEQLGTNARTGQDLAASVNRSARNLGLSGRIQAGQGLANKLAATQGSTLATKAENEAANLADYNSKLGTADTREQSANESYKAAMDAATGLENEGVAGYANNLSNAQNKIDTLASLGLLDAGGMKQYTPSTDIVSYLNGLVPTATTGVVSGANQGAISGEQGMNVNDLIKKLIGYGYSQ